MQSGNKNCEVTDDLWVDIWCIKRWIVAGGYEELNIQEAPCRKPGRVHVPSHVGPVI